MAHISEDKVLESGAANTTVSFTVAGAITGFRTFASQLATNDTCFYSGWQVDASGNPTGNFENGLGTYSAANTLTRTTILESSNAGAAVTFSGTVWVSIGLLASKTLQLNNQNAINLKAISIEPESTAAGGILLYPKTVITGNTEIYRKSETGKEVAIQDSFAFSRVQKFQASTNTLVGIGVASFTLVGNTNTVTTSSGSARNNKTRTQYITNATASSLVSLYANNANLAAVYRGGANGEGGFRAIFVFSLSALPATVFGFFGFSDVITAPVIANPLTATTPGKVGMALNATTGNWQLVNNITGTAPTVLDLGANFPLNVNDLYELILFVAPFNTTAQAIQYKINRYTTNPTIPAFTTSGTLSANIPAATTLLHPVLTMNNNTTASQAAFHAASLTIESDN